MFHPLSGLWKGILKEDFDLTSIDYTKVKPSNPIELLLMGSAQKLSGGPKVKTYTYWYEYYINSVVQFLGGIPQVLSLLRPGRNVVVRRQMTTPKIYLLVIAHPDDESMFFLPTLKCLLDQHCDQPQTQFHILCLSNGNFDGLGQIRETELKDAARIISPRIQVTILNDEKLQDGPSESWDVEYMEQVMMKFWKDKRLVDCGKEKREIAVLTFDQVGVSGHRNHTDTYRGMRYFFDNFKSQQRMRKGQETLEASLRNVKLTLLTLDTIQNPILKYFPIVDVICLIIATLWIGLIHPLQKVLGKTKPSQDLATTWMYDSDTKLRTWMFDPFLVRRAMKSHRSQFVWYRRLFIIFSRYSYANSMVKVAWGGARDGCIHDEKGD